MQLPLQNFRKNVHKSLIHMEAASPKMRNRHFGVELGRPLNRRPSNSGRHLSVPRARKPKLWHLLSVEVARPKAPNLPQRPLRLPESALPRCRMIKPTATRGSACTWRASNVSAHTELFVAASSRRRLRCAMSCGSLLQPAVACTSRNSTTPTHSSELANLAVSAQFVSTRPMPQVGHHEARLHHHLRAQRGGLPGVL